MDRAKIILSHISKNDLGLEIGPSFNPIAPKKDGYNVEIIDHASKEGLIDKYRIDQNVRSLIGNIEEVDYVWEGGSYSELTKKRGHYDYIIASHVIEHVTNMIGFLSDCIAMLKNNGLLALVVPDKRYTFDHLRPVTTFGNVIDDFIMDRNIHSPGTVADYFMFTTNALCYEPNQPACRNINWIRRPHDPDSVRLSYSEKLIRKNIRQAERGEYIDTHHYVFTDVSFRLLVEDLNALGYGCFNILEFHETETIEFIVILQKTKERLSYDPQHRLGLLQQIQRADEANSLIYENEWLRSDSISYYIDFIAETDSGCSISGWAYCPGQDSSKFSVVVALLHKKTSRLHFFSTSRHFRNDIAANFGEKYRFSGFCCNLVIPKDEYCLEADKIEIFLYRPAAGPKTYEAVFWAEREATLLAATEMEHNRYEAVVRSHSWKLTAPLRKITALLRKKN